MKSVWENLKGSISLLRGFSPQNYNNKDNDDSDDDDEAHGVKLKHVLKVTIVIGSYVQTRV